MIHFPAQRRITRQREKHDEIARRAVTVAIILPAKRRQAPLCADARRR